MPVFGLPMSAISGGLARSGRAPCATFELSTGGSTTERGVWSNALDVNRLCLGSADRERAAAGADLEGIAQGRHLMHSDGGSGNESELHQAPSKRPLATDVANDHGLVELGFREGHVQKLTFKFKKVKRDV